MPGLNFFSDGAKDWSGGQPPSPDSDFGDGGERMRSGTREAGKAQQGNLDKLSNYSESSGGGSGNSGFGSDDYFGRSGGERTKQDAKPQTKSHYKNAASASNSSSLNSSSGGFSGSGSKNPSAKTGGSNAPGSSSKKSGGEAASAKPAHAPPNFQMQSPMSEGKTQVQNAGLAVHSPAQNVSAAQKIQPPASIAQMQPLQAHFESMQTITQMQEVRVQQQAIAREQATIHQEHSEAPQQIAMHEQPTAQQEQLAATMHQEQSVQAMLQEPQAQTVPIAVQRIRTEKKKAGEKILPRIPIPVSSNADNGKNKKENSMNAINEKEKITPVAQIMAPVPRRVSPTGIVALIPLRNLFERKGKNKKEEKHECASKVCGWCGRKAA